MVSIRDIAKLARVSIATVSRTLSDPEVVSEATRNRVLEAIESTGYVANSMARGLRKQRTYTILVLVPDIGNPFFSQVIQGIEDTAHDQGYRILLGDTQESPQREQNYSNLAKQRQVDGIILLSASIPFDDSVSAAEWPPMVVGCEHFKDAILPTVQIDNVAAAEEACNHLIALGHRRIGLINGPKKSPLSIDRLAGYRRALRSAGLRYRTALVVDGDFTLEAGVAGTSHLMALASPPTALFCANDEMAIGAIRTARKRGLRVPGDLSVVGFDDIEFARYCEPSLTTVHQPRKAIGQQLMKQMYQLIQTDLKPDKKPLVLPHSLVVRESTSPPLSIAD